MAFKDLYVVLGVPRTGSTEAIRARYRDLAKQYHPDLSGEPTGPAFREIAEAYEVLTDPQRRRLYNEQLTLHAEPRRRRGVEAPAPEVSVLDEVSIGSGFGRIRPSFEAMMERFRRNFTGARVPKSDRPESLGFEVILTAEEAASGSIVPVGVPVYRPCMGCHGTGRDWVFPCPQCRGQGAVEREAQVRVHIPPMRRSSALVEVPLDALGISNFYLQIHLRIGTDRP